MSTMYMLSKRGDTEVCWEPSDAKSVARARRAFEKYRRGHALAFVVSHPGDEPTCTRDFDPDASEIILTRPLIGG
jgi:hypothetical protein